MSRFKSKEEYEAWKRERENNKSQPPQSQIKDKIFTEKIPTALGRFVKGLIKPFKITTPPTPSIDVVTESRCQLVKFYFDGINQFKKIPTIITHILLKQGEEAYLEGDDIEFLETRAVRKYSSSGGAVRIAKGIYIGGSSGTSSSHDELKKIDQGKLILTNQRLIFDGSLNARDIKLDKIISVDTNFNGIEISLENKAKSQIFEGISNPILWKSLIYYIRQIPENGELPNANIKFEFNF